MVVYVCHPAKNSLLYFVKNQQMSYYTMMQQNPIENDATSSTTQYRFRYVLPDKNDSGACNRYYKCENLDIAMSQFEAGCDHRGIQPNEIAAFKWEPDIGWIAVTH